MEPQEMNRACELAYLVAREGVEQDPPIDPPPTMRMFLYVQQFTPRALEVARLVLAENPDFRSRVATAASAEKVGAPAMAWLQKPGVLTSDVSATDAVSPSTAAAGVESPAVESDAVPVTATEEGIRSELEELKSLVGQLAVERAHVGDDLAGLETRLHDSDEILDETGEGTFLGATGSTPAPTIASVTNPSTASITAQIRSLHADLKTARAERNHAQEAKELAILEQAEMGEELEHLRMLAQTAADRLSDLETRIESASTETSDLEVQRTQLLSQKSDLEAETARLEAQTAQLSSEASSVAAERDAAKAESERITVERSAVEEQLATARADLDRLSTELNQVRSSAGASVDDLRAAVAAHAAMAGHVDVLSAAQASAKLEMERVNAALANRDSTDAEKISALEAALASVVAERDALQEKLDHVRSTVTAVKSEMASLDSSVTEAEAVAGSLGDKLMELRSSVEVVGSEAIDPIDVSLLSTPAVPVVTLPVMPSGETPAAAAEPDFLVQDEGAQTNSDAGATLEDVATADSVEDYVAVSADSELPQMQTLAVEAEIDDVADATTEGIASGKDPAAPDFTAGLLDDLVKSPAIAAEGDEPEDLDEVHSLISQTVATFEGEDTENQATERERGGLTSLFSGPGSSVDDALSVPDQEPSALGGFAAAAAAATAAVGAGVAGRNGGPSAEEVTDDLTEASFEGSEDADQVETIVDAGEIEPDDGTTDELAQPDSFAEAAEVDAPSEGTQPAVGKETESTGERGPIAIPDDILSDPIAVARHVVNTEDVVLLIDGDPVAAMGWPSVERVDQRRNLVHFLSALAGSSGAAPDVLLDRDYGVDRLPDSRSVRVRITNEEGTVAAQLTNLIDTYPADWPVVVVTDNMDLAQEVAMKGATILDNGQLLDLFIAS